MGYPRNVDSYPRNVEMTVCQTTQNSLHIQILSIACQDINTKQNARSWRKSQRTFLLYEGIFSPEKVRKAPPTEMNCALGAALKDFFRLLRTYSKVGCSTIFFGLMLLEHVIRKICYFFSSSCYRIFPAFIVRIPLKMRGKWGSYSESNLGNSLVVGSLTYFSVLANFPRFFLSVMHWD